MGKYIGPKSKIARKFGEAIYGADKVLEKRNFPPGQHGLARKRKKVSEYGTQLSEKQKAKYTYGLLEKQFARTYDQAARMGGITGENLLKLLEYEKRWKDAKTALAIELPHRLLFLHRCKQEGRDYHEQGYCHT